MGAPGPHDFAVRAMCRTSIGTRSSTAFRSTFVTTRTPLLGAERCEQITISETAKVIYFCMRILNTSSSLIPLSKFQFTRTRFGLASTPIDAIRRKKNELISARRANQLRRHADDLKIIPAQSARK